MSSVVDELYSVRYSTVVLPTKPVPQSEAHIIKNEHFIDQLTDLFSPSQRVYGNVHSNTPIVICFGPQDSPLQIALLRHLTSEDIALILFSVEDNLWQWLNSNTSLTVASLVLQGDNYNPKLINHSHSYASVRSILIRCITTYLTMIQRFSRSYPKIDGAFDDDTRLLVKLVFDLIHFSEEIGDQQREDEDNELEAQRNYTRALKLCALLKRI